MTNGELEQVELGSYPLGEEAQSEEALEAAVAAYDNGRGEWPTMTVAERIACVQEFTRQMVAQKRQVVSLIMWEIGKNLADSEKEFDRTVDYIRATIDALKELDNSNSRFVEVEGTIGQIRRAPMGVVLCMGPYNYPLNETFATLIPALIMGNTMVFKPPQYGTLLFYPLLEAFRSAFPKGVINTVYGRGEVVVPRLLNSGKINVLTLIGSSKVADHLKKLHPKLNRLRAMLGLDAKNAAIVLPDADIELAVKECLLGSLSFNGQRCTALKMLIVHQSIVEPFLRRFSEELAKLKVGMPWEKGVSITPLPERDKVAYMTEVVEDAVAKGARVINEGGGAFAKHAVLPGGRVPGEGGHEALPRGAVRPDRAGHAVRRCRDGAGIHHHLRARPAGQHLQHRPGQDRGAGRSAGQSGLPGEHQLPVPARPRRLPLHRAQGFGRGHAVGDRRAPLLLDPLDDRGQADGRRASSCSTRSSRSTSPSSSTPATSSDSQGRRPRDQSCVVTVTPRSSPRSGRPVQAAEVIQALFDAGTDVFRFNFSHGSHEDHRARSTSCATIEQETGRPIAVLADLQGPKLRLGTTRRRPVTLAEGGRIRLDLDPTPGDRDRVPLPHPEIFAALGARRPAADRRRQGPPGGRAGRSGDSATARVLAGGRFPSARASASSARSCRSRPLTDKDRARPDLRARTRRRLGGPVVRAASGGHGRAARAGGRQACDHGEARKTFGDRTARGDRGPLRRGDGRARRPRRRDAARTGADHPAPGAARRPGAGQAGDRRDPDAGVA